MPSRQKSPFTPSRSSCWVWSKLSAQKWEDAWEERLAFLPTGALTIIHIPGHPKIRLEVYSSKKEVTLLHQQFGGSIREFKSRELEKSLQEDTPLLKIRSRLVVCRDPIRWKEYLKSKKKSATKASPEWIWIPAGLAFGTGSHSTTQGCLRQLCDWAEPQNKPWRMIDLGCGSGILAIAAEKLGADHAEAIDYDPNCIRITSENAKANACKLIQPKQTDVLKWRPRKEFFDLICANLYSDILLKVTDKIHKALRPNGHLIFSGVLRDQLPECLAAFKQSGIHVKYYNPRGKWVYGFCQKPR
ncbi:MAG: 50S ribosomal protein L11 methyltransferase [Chthoniobacterales bacterium]